MHREKLLQLFSWHPMDQHVSPCYHSFLTVTYSFQSKVTTIGEIHAKKIAHTVLLYLLRIAFAAPLLKPTLGADILFMASMLFSILYIWADML